MTFDKTVTTLIVFCRDLILLCYIFLYLRADVDLWKAYMTQCREELARRLVGKVCVCVIMGADDRPGVYNHLNLIKMTRIILVI